MTIFLRLLAEDDMAIALADSCARVRQCVEDARCFEMSPEAFNAMPGKPFAYWSSDTVRSGFLRFPAFEQEERSAKQGLATADDFRFVRLWWESPAEGWVAVAKGGAF